jgi:hypothetical protein
VTGRRAGWDGVGGDSIVILDFTAWVHEDPVTVAGLGRSRATRDKIEAAFPASAKATSAKLALR